MLTEALAFISGGIVWSLLTLIFVLLVWVCEEQEAYGSAIVATIIIFLLAASKFPLLSLIRANPWNAFYIALAYTVIGVAWSFVKWSLFLLARKEKYVGERASWRPTSGESEEAMNKRWHEYIERVLPKAKYHKALITGWAAY